MNKYEKISRRKMFKQLAFSFTIPTSLLWYFGTKRKIETARKQRVVIPNNLSDGISFIDNIIINKTPNNTTVFSSKCTHLGCKINSTENDKLVCPCHGSKFSFDGIPQNGPATVPLNKLEIKEEKSPGELVVYV